MERVDKDSNRAFYDSQRADDRRRFDEQPSKVHLTETLVPVGRLARRAGGADSRRRRRKRRLCVGDRSGRSGIRGRGGHQPGDGRAAARGSAPAKRTWSGTWRPCRLRARVLRRRPLRDVAPPCPGSGAGSSPRLTGCSRPGGLLLAVEPCALRAGPAGSSRVPGLEHEFRFTLRFLTAPDPRSRVPDRSDHRQAALDPLHLAAHALAVVARSAVGRSRRPRAHEAAGGQSASPSSRSSGHRPGTAPGQPRRRNRPRLPAVPWTNRSPNRRNARLLGSAGRCIRSRTASRSCSPNFGLSLDSLR